MLLLCSEQNSAVYAPITFKEIELLQLTQTSHIVGFVITATQQGRIYRIIKTVNTTKPQLSPSKLMTFIPQPSKIYTNVQKKNRFRACLLATSNYDVLTQEPLSLDHKITYLTVIL